jgi:predicted transcriptional regulator
VLTWRYHRVCRAEDRQHVFYATVTREQVRRTVVSEFSELTERLFSGDVAGLISQLLTTRDARPEDLARAREIIEQKERALREAEGK